jgi:AcrR family transcriptional regulator
MSRLTQEQVREILERHSNGESISFLARELGVAKMVVYYHIKKKGAKRIEHPKCLRDYQMNEIVRLQQKMKDNPHLARYIRNEIARMRLAMTIKIENCSEDPFILQ